MAAKATINELFGSDSDEEEEQVDTQVRITHMLKPTSVPDPSVLITYPMLEHDMDAAYFMHSARIVKVMCHISRQGNLPSQLVSGAEDDAGEDTGNEEAPERSRARNLYTGEAQYQEAMLRKRIGALMTPSTLMDHTHSNCSLYVTTCIISPMRKAHGAVYTHACKVAL